MSSTEHHYQRIQLKWLVSLDGGQEPKADIQMDIKHWRKLEERGHKEREKIQSAKKLDTRCFTLGEADIGIAKLYLTIQKRNK